MKIATSLALLIAFLTLTDGVNPYFLALQIAKTTSHFSMHLYRQLTKEKKNFVYSPLGLSSALAMLYHGVRGRTEVEMRRVLYYDRVNIPGGEIPRAYKELLRSLIGETEKISLYVANAALVQKQFHLVPEYKNNLEHFFKAFIESVDFQKNEQDAKTKVNTWVKNITRGNIDSLLDSTHPLTILLLLNSVYFEGKWRSRFFPREDRFFYNNGQTSEAKKVPMMGVLTFYKYTHPSPEYSVLELPYADENFGMWILLPKERDGLSRVEQMFTASTVQDIGRSLFEEIISFTNVTMPKFRLDFNKDMKETLTAMGLGRIFDRTADFSGIIGDGNIEVSNVVHRTTIEVNDMGTTASSATGLERILLSIPKPVVVDHPFCFWIVDRRNLAVIFSGRVTEL